MDSYRLGKETFWRMRVLRGTAAGVVGPHSNLGGEVCGDQKRSEECPSAQEVRAPVSVVALQYTLIQHSVRHPHPSSPLFPEKQLTPTLVFGQDNEPFM